MKYPEDRFQFTPDLGRRLRQIRIHAGLKQDEVARLMGRTGRSSSSLISRLELGKARYPTFGLIADYLKACGASFSDLGDVLDQYTTGLGEKALAELKRKRRPKKKKPQTIQERVEQVMRSFGSLGKKQRLEDRLYELFKQEGMPRAFGHRKRLAEYGRKVFSALERARQARSVAEDRILADKGIDKDTVERVGKAVAELFEEMERTGALDHKTLVDAGGIVAGRVKRPKLNKAEQRFREDYDRRFRWWQSMRQACIHLAYEDVREPLSKMGVKNPGIYFPLVLTFIGIAEETNDNPDERWKRAGEYIEKARDSKRARWLAEMVFKRYEAYKHNIPAKPDWK